MRYCPLPWCRPIALPSLKHPVIASPPTLSTITKLPGTYIAILVDPTAGTAPDLFEVLHYILSDLTSANTSTTRDRASLHPLVTDAPPLAPYLVPTPSPGHVHTYTATLWKQPDGFTVPDAFLKYLPLNPSNVTNRYPFNLTDFVTAAGLGQPIAGGYFDLLNTTGSATATGGSSTSQGSSTPTGKLWRPVVRPRYEVREAV